MENTSLTLGEGTGLFFTLCLYRDPLESGQVKAELGTPPASMPALGLLPISEKGSLSFQFHLHDLSFVLPSSTPQKEVGHDNSPHL